MSAAVSAPERRQPRILVADDTDTIRALFEKLLTNDGYQVISAVDGIEALDAVSVPLLQSVQTDMTTLGFTLVVALVTGVVFGLAPALVCAPSRCVAMQRRSERHGDDERQTTTSPSPAR